MMSRFYFRIVKSATISFPCTNHVWFALTSICFVEDSNLFILFVFDYTYLCPTQFSYHRMFVSFSSNTTGTTCREQELVTLPEHLSSPQVLSWIRFARSLVFCVVFCRSLFVLLYFFSWSLCCLSFVWLPLWYLQILLSSQN